MLVATEGAAVLAAAQRELPDLVLSDLMLPNLDGRALAAQLHANPQTTHIPVVLMSAAYHLQVDDAFAAVIHKPFDLDVLVETIHPYLPERCESRPSLSRKRTRKILSIGRMPQFLC